MSNFNSNINNNYRLKTYQPKFKSAPAEQNAAEIQQQVEIPYIYQNENPGYEEEGLVDRIKKADMMGMVYPWFETPLLMGGTCFALSKAIDKYTEACGGEYEKSLLGKVTKFGDNLENSKFVQSEGVQKTLGFVKKGANKIDNLAKRSSLITAFRTTPARPEKAMPKSELITQEVRFLEDFNKIVETLHLDKTEVAPEKEANILEKILDGFNLGKSDSTKLKNLGLDKQEKEFLEKTFGKNYKSLPQAKLVDTILLKRLEYSPEDIVKIVESDSSTLKTRQAILEKLGLTIEDLNDIKTNPEKNIGKVKEAMSKAGKKVKIGVAHFPVLGKLQAFERTISCDQIGNKLKSITLNEGAKTKTGRFLANAVHKIHRGFTFGGGKMALCLWIAPSLAIMMKNTVKADKDSKIGTVANGFIEAISWVFTFPLAIATTYALGGLKFAGMSKENVKNFMDLTDDFNKKVDAGELMDKAKYDEALKKLKEQRKILSKVDKQNLFAKIVKKIAGIFYCDLNTIRSYKGTNALENIVRKIPNFCRHITCEPIRFVLAMFAIESFFRGIIEKSTKAIFGNHYDHFKEDEYAAKKKEQKKFTKENLQKRLYETQARNIAGVSSAQTINQMPETLPPHIEKIAQESKTSTENIPEEKVEQPIITDTIEKTTETKEKNTETPEVTLTNAAEEKNSADNYTYIPNAKQNINNERSNTIRDNYTYIPSSENVIANQKKNEFDTNKYIPSQQPVNFVKTFDNSGLEDAIKRADRAEEKALQILSGNFNGI